MTATFNAADEGGAQGRGRGVALGIALAAAVLLLALLSRAALLPLPPVYDELYQTLAAQGFQATGRGVILDGSYEKAALLSRLIALAYDVVGDRGIAVARVVAATLPGALIVAIAFAWTRARAGLPAAAIAAALMIFSPLLIEISQFARFYALQGLGVLVGVLLIHDAVAPGRGAAGVAARLAGAAAAFALAVHLQPASLIAALGVALWGAVFVLPDWLRARPWLWAVLAVGGAAAAALLLSGALDETLGGLWSRYRTVPAEVPRDPTFYHRHLRDAYPTLWPLLPVAALVAIAARPRAGGLCVAVFATCVVLVSMGGMSATRYLAMAMPFFFIAWAMALATLAPALAAWLVAAAERTLPGRGRGRRALARAAAAFVVLFAVAANAAFERALQDALGRQNRMLADMPRFAWPTAPEMLRPWIAEQAVIVTNQEMMAVAWLGDFDLGHNVSRFSELPAEADGTRPQFAIDPRHGRPMIDRFEALGRVVACAPVGVYLSQKVFLERGALAVVETMRAQGAQVEYALAETGDLALVAWRTPDAQLEDCAGMVDVERIRARAEG